MISVKIIVTSPSTLGQTAGDGGDGEGQGDLAYCSPWGHEESNVTW